MSQKQLCIFLVICSAHQLLARDETTLKSGIPNAPRITQIICNPPKAHSLDDDSSRAYIEWESNGDNGASIRNYTIEYNIEYEPDVWIPLEDVIFADSPLRFMVSMAEHRYANYTFRVIARNEVGSSVPSEPSEMCTSESDMPYDDPRGVKCVGTAPGNMMISWEPIPPSEHNGPGFHYVIRWRRFQDERNCQDDDKWNEMKVTDSMQNNITIDGLSVFIKYEILVKSVNDNDESYRDNIYIAYSGEDKPTKSPENFMLVNVPDCENVILRWDPVPPESVNGNISCYVIRIWNDVDDHENVRETVVADDTFQTTIAKLRHFTTYYALIFVKNRLSSGPTSEILEFQTQLCNLSAQCRSSVMGILFLLFIILVN